MGQALSRLVFMILAAFMLAACGGSNSSSSSSGTTDSTGSGGSSGGTTTTASASITLDLQNSGGTSITTITESQQGRLLATVLDSSGVPVSGLVVSFSITGGTTAAGELDPSSGTALTNSSGIAQISLLAGSEAGAATVTAQATVNGEAVSGTLSFSTSLANIGLGSGSGGTFQNGALSSSIVAPAQLSAGGTATITATVVDLDNSNALFASPIAVSFSSSCVNSGDATIDSSVTTVNGTATATYRANGCTGSDTITATAPGGLSATTSIAIAGAAAGSIEFVSATPATIALKGTGDAGRPETATVVFKVLDVNGNTVSGQDVDFELTSTAGGLSISPTTATSDGSGLVQAIVSSGTIPSNVRVKASFNNGSTDIFTVSSNLTISTGLPDNDSISLSADIFNPQGWDRDGENVEFTVRLADRFNNPVPDNTTVLFTTEGGSIQPSCVTTDGACSVTWTSQNPRPDVPVGQEGRITILATAIGEENFIDTDGSGFFDDGEAVTQLGEAYRDDDEDDAKDASEFFRDFDGNAQFDGADAFYNGSLCTSAAVTLGHCARLIEVRADMVIVMSSRVPVLTRTNQPGIAITSSPSPLEVTDKGTGVVSAVISDINDNAPPNGTTITYATTVGTLGGQTSFTVGNQLGPFAVPAVTFTGEDTDTVKSGILTVTAVTPAGDETVTAIPVTINP